MKKQPKPSNGKKTRRPKKHIGKPLRNSAQALSNSLDIRELTWAWEHEGQLWAKEMKYFIETLNTVVADAGGALSANRRNKYRVQYKKLLIKGKIECLEPDEFLKKGKRKRINKSRSQNLLDRLKEYEDHLIMFMENERVAFSINLDPECLD